MKMLKKVNTIILGLAVLLAFGCGEDDKQDNPTPSNVTQKNCLLIKQSQNGFTLEYAYNSAGKVEGVYTIDPGTGQRFRAIEVIYNADGNISEKRSYDQTTNVNNYKDVYTYTADQLLSSITKSTLRNNIWKDDVVTRYKYNAAKQLIKKSYHSLPDTATVSFDIFSYPAADHIVKDDFDKDSNGNFVPRGVHHIYYDDKKYFGISRGYFNLSSTIYEEGLISKHNIISTTAVDYKWGTTTTYSYAYIYNAEGFPIQCSNPVSGSIYWNYEYKCQ